MTRESRTFLYMKYLYSYYFLLLLCPKGFPRSFIAFYVIQSPSQTKTCEPNLKIVTIALMTPMTSTCAYQTTREITNNSIQSNPTTVSLSPIETHILQRPVIISTSTEERKLSTQTNMSGGYRKRKHRGRGRSYVISTSPNSDNEFSDVSLFINMCWFVCKHYFTGGNINKKILMMRKYYAKFRCGWRTPAAH